jgi:hypothetical protein
VPIFAVAPSQVARDPQHTWSNLTRDATSRIGSLIVVLSLEDFGSLSSDHAHSGSMSSLSQSHVVQSTKSAAGAQRDSLEYQTAWELEMWKRSEMSVFETRLRELEAKRIKELETEFAKADAKRQEQLARKQAELVALEQKNKQFFQELEIQVFFFFLLSFFF